MGKLTRSRDSLRSFSLEKMRKMILNHEGSREKILDPRGPFLQKWNWIFILTCLVALSLDPLFFYIPIINGDKKCLDLDRTLELTACILRTFTDIFYLIHIIFQFRTGFIVPPERVFARVELVQDPLKIARRYLFSYFIIDVLAVLPLPQIVIMIIVPRLNGSRSLNTKEILKFLVLIQYIPKVLRIYPIYKDVEKISGILHGAAISLLHYMIASHVFGAYWYLLSIERETTCWLRTCRGQSDCTKALFDCDGDHTHVSETFNLSCPIQTPNTTIFDFGIFLGALQSDIVVSKDFSQKFLYCFWWGLQNIRTLKQAPMFGKFALQFFISIYSLILISCLIGVVVQTFMQSLTLRLEEMKVKRRDTEQWMSNRMLPESLRNRIRRYDQYKWQATNGVDEDDLVQNLPKDIRRDLKRHLCWDLLRRVPMFDKMDERHLDAMCARLKPELYVEDSYIVREGDPVEEMLFVMRGRLLAVTTDGGRSFLTAGDFCGEELLTWALDPHSSFNLPISTSTVKSLTKVEVFALTTDNLKFVASQFRRLHSKELRHTFRFYSQRWRNWAACFIQAAWRRYARKKREELLREEEYRLQDALARGGDSSRLFGATDHISIEICSGRETRTPERISTFLLLKPAEPDFTTESK